jgi:hypothetical protein
VSISVNIHPEGGFRAQSDPKRTTVWIAIGGGPVGDVGIFLTTPEQCDELAAAAGAAKRLLAAGAAEGDPA